jgi:hypothetical protein
LETNEMFFERTIGDLLWLAAFCGEQIDMAPAGVLQNGGQGLAIRRPDGATNRPSASAIDRGGVKSGGFADGLAGEPVEFQQIQPATEIFLFTRNVDNLIAAGRPVPVCCFFFCRSKKTGHGSVRTNDEKTVDATPSTLKEYPTPLGRPMGRAVGCLTRITAAGGCTRNTMWSSARYRHNPDASLAGIGNLLAVGRPIQTGFSALSAREQDGPSTTGKKQHNLARAGQSDGLAVRRKYVVIYRVEGEQILQGEASTRLRVKSKREKGDKGGNRGAAEELTKSVHFSFPCLQSRY